MAPGIADDYWDHHPGPFEAILLVEISDSSLRQDQGRKAETYARAGVADYWIVNLKNRTLEVRRQPVNGEYLSLSVSEENETISPLAAPHAQVHVASLLPLKRPKSVNPESEYEHNA